MNINTQDTTKYIFEKFNLKPQRPPYNLPITRDGLGEIFKDLKFKVGAEIGVERGYFSELLCKENPDMKLYCIDKWKVYKGYRDHTRQEKLDRYCEESKKRLSKYNCEIIKDWSMDAVKKFKDESLDFVFIDGNHDFQHCTNDIAEWTKKVRKGGIVSGHDYVRGRSSIECHVKEVVGAWTYAYNYRVWFILTGLPTSPNSNNVWGSWAWVK
jgi:hypothetical protein